MENVLLFSYVPFITTLFVLWITYVIIKGWPSRATFYRLRKQGVPMPPWNPIFGHLLCLPPILAKFPSNIHQNYLLTEISKTFEQSDSAFYMDLWPFSDAFIVIASPSMSIQACQTYDLDKPKSLERFFYPFAGGNDNLFITNGPAWKKSRALFNPGFNANYLLSQMDHIVEETTEFVAILREHAEERDIFSLDELLCDFTMDIIGAVTINSRLRSQRSYNPLASSMRSQVRWKMAEGEFNPFKRFNPMRTVVQWYNSYQMNKYVSQELDKRFAVRKVQDDSPSRSIMDLVLDNYFVENPSARSASQMDPVFKEWAIVQIRLFLFAGHDSTASAIAYCYHLLSKHPEVMAKIRAEHDEIFGEDPKEVSAQLLEQPQKVNLLPYTTAVIKEAMRLYPAASGVRTGTKDAVLRDPDGNEYSTEGMTILTLHLALQRNPKYWKDADSFIPERWTVGSEDPLYPPKGGWRPFEFGPRNCIGQTLVMQDVKTVLVMTLREFDICAAYDEWDIAHPRSGNKTAWGERAYQVFVGAAHPADGFPCRVRGRK